jgi:antitoxin component YwqK of YwqJK toxin-antitoxin module
MKKSLIIFLLILTNVAFAQNKTKLDVTKSLVGNYELKSISAFMGANTMVDYDKANGKWKGFMSMNMGGQRNGDAITITPEVLKKLKSMEIIVKPDLSISFNCNGNQIANIPFKEDGMVFEIKGTIEEYSQYNKLKPELTFEDGQLFFYAKDYTEETALAPYDIAEVVPNTIIVSYDTKLKEFNVSLCTLDGMGTSTYSFKKKLVVKK